MSTVNTSKLIGAALDWAVAKCEGDPEVINGRPWITTGSFFSRVRHIEYSPSTHWSQGGPLIEREEIGLKRNAPCSTGREWEASPSITAKGAGGKYGYGPTPLIAAMRCYVTSKLGNQIEIPSELL